MTTTPRKALSATAATVIGALTLVACSPSDNAAPADPSTSVTTMTSTPEATTSHEAPTSTVTETDAPEDETVISSLNAGSTEPSQAMPEGEWDHGIADVRVGAHDGFDRVVIELTGAGTPGWFASYTTEPRQQASGFPVDYTGDVAMELMVNGVALPYESGTPDLPTGPVEGVEPAGSITGVNHQGIFEGQAQFVIGLNGGARPYTVTTLDNPARVVVDIQN